MHKITKLTAAILTMLLLQITIVFALGTLQREPPEGELRLGQRVRVDDGTCPSGQVKQVVAAKMTEQGILRTRTCVKR
jgi:hypothetical protein